MRWRSLEVRPAECMTCHCSTAGVQRLVCQILAAVHTLQRWQAASPLQTPCRARLPSASVLLPAVLRYCTFPSVPNAEAGPATCRLPARHILRMVSYSVSC